MHRKEKSPHAGGQGGGGKNVTSNNNYKISSFSSSVNPFVANIPQELKQFPQWVCWKHEKQNGKLKKVPISPYTAEKAAVNDSRTWNSCKKAIKHFELHQRNGMLGVGFVFTGDDPYCGIDIDNCKDPETGELTPLAQELIETLDSYTEISPSGTGIHIIAKAKLRGGVGSQNCCRVM